MFPSQLGIQEEKKNSEKQIFPSFVSLYLKKQLFFMCF